jgi:hypothetical protein
MEKLPPTPWNIPVPGSAAGETRSRALPAGRWDLPTPGGPHQVHVEPIESGMIVTTSYDDGTVIKATMHADGRLNVHINKPVAVDLGTREIRILRD